MRRFGIGLLWVFVLLSSSVAAINTFDKSEIISYADFSNAVREVKITKCADQDCHVYAVASQITGEENKIVITRMGTQNVIWRLDNLITASNQQVGGLIKCATLAKGAGYKIENLNNAGIQLKTFYFYIVQANADNVGTPVYDTTYVGDKIAPPVGNSYATILSAEPYFTLSKFDTETVDSTHDLQVFTSGFDSGSSATKILQLGVKDHAYKSITTVVGPIATVYFAKLDAKASFTAAIDRKDRYTTSFEPGASLVAMSPGYTGLGSSYPTKAAAKVYYKFVSSSVSPINVRVKGITTENITITTNKSSYTVGSKAIDDSRNFDTDTIEVSWTRVDKDSFFLVQISKSGMHLMPPLCVPLLMAAALRFF